MKDLSTTWTVRGCAFAALLLATGAGCSEDNADGDQQSPSLSAGKGADSAGRGATAGQPGEAGKSSAAGASAMGQAGAAAGSGAAGRANARSGGGPASGYIEVGVCGQRGKSTVNATSFEGYEEFYIIGEEGFGDDICVVRFDVKRVGDAPDGCDDPTADVDCLWTHLVEFSNPQVVTDTDGVCADSERALDEDAIAEIDGSQAAYGFVSEFAGHNSVVMKYDEATDKWDAYGNGTWDDEAENFGFDRRDGFCNY